MHGANPNNAVISELNQRFPSSVVADAISLLTTTPLPLLESKASSLERARVHMAAIKVADGDLDNLKKAVQLASVDWRDLLVQAGLSGADWKDVLTNSGFRAP